MERLRRFWRETRRLWWLLLVLSLAVVLVEPGMLHPLSKWALVLFVLLKGTAAAIVWHLWRSQMFPYLDYQAELHSGDLGRAVGASLLLGLLGAAFILGVLVAV